MKTQGLDTADRQGRVMAMGQYDLYINGVRQAIPVPAGSPQEAIDAYRVKAGNGSVINGLIAEGKVAAVPSGAGLPRSEARHLMHEIVDDRVEGRLRKGGDGVYYLGSVKIVDAQAWPSGVTADRWQAFDLSKPISAQAERNSGQADREQFIGSGAKLRPLVAKLGGKPRKKTTAKKKTAPKRRKTTARR